MVQAGSNPGKRMDKLLAKLRQAVAPQQRGGVAIRDVRSSTPTFST